MRWSVELSKKNWLGRINMQKVVIALYALGDDESVLCTATNAQLGKACGLSAEAIKTHLHRLDNDGHIRTFQKEGYHITKRIIVFLTRLKPRPLSPKSRSSAAKDISAERSNTQSMRRIIPSGAESRKLLRTNTLEAFACDIDRYRPA